jgi:hypothetical protein
LGSSNNQRDSGVRETSLTKQWRELAEQIEWLEPQNSETPGQ